MPGELPSLACKRPPSLATGSSAGDPPGFDRSRRGSRGWLRADRGVETYALCAPDSPKLPGLPSPPGSPDAVTATRSEGGKKKLRRSGSTPAQRWWLREVTHDKSWCEGLYEINTGLVPVYVAPSTSASSPGVLRAGTRFQGTPHTVDGRVWIRLRTDGPGVPKAVFALTAAKREPSEVQRSSIRVLRTSSVSDLGHTDGMDMLSQSREDEALWMQENLQYMTRVRDVVKGIQWGGKPLGYSVCINHSGSPKEAGRRRTNS